MIPIGGPGGNTFSHWIKENQTWKFFWITVGIWAGISVFVLFGIIAVIALVSSGGVYFQEPVFMVIGTFCGLISILLPTGWILPFIVTWACTFPFRKKNTRWIIITAYFLFILLMSIILAAVWNR
ncbi:MAG: hypothetical protein ABIH34_02960 [Nanoarchaeota archaeon]